MAFDIGSFLNVMGGTVASTGKTISEGLLARRKAAIMAERQAKEDASQGIIDEANKLKLSESKDAILRAGKARAAISDTTKTALEDESTMAELAPLSAKLGMPVIGKQRTQIELAKSKPDIMSNLDIPEAKTFVEGLNKEQEKRLAEKESGVKSKRDFEEAKILKQMELDARKETGKEKDSKTDFTQEQQLRGQLDTMSKDYLTIRDSYKRIKAVTKEPTPAGDMALIYNYMKMLDPGSVVRESEFQMAAQTGAYGDRIKAAVSKVASGKRLSDDMRKDFVKNTEDIYQGQKKSHTALIDKYKKISNEYGLSPDRVVSGLQVDDDVPAKTQSGNTAKSDLELIRERRKAKGGQ